MEDDHPVKLFWRIRMVLAKSLSLVNKMYLLLRASDANSLFFIPLGEYSTT